VALVLTLLLRGDGIIRGSDSYGYMMMFERIKEYDSLSKIYYMNDYLFSNHAFLIKSITEDSNIYLAILFFSSTIILFLAYYWFFMQYQSPYFYLSIALLLSTSTYYLYNINALRQGISASLVLLSLAVMFNYKRYFSSFLLMILAVLMHKSALIVFFIFLLIENVSLKINKSLYIFFLSILTGFLINDLLLQVAYYFDLNYVVYKLEGLSKSVTGHTSVAIKMIVLIITLTYFHIIARNAREDKLYLYLLNYYTYCASVVMLFSGFESMFNRLLMFTNIIEPILFTLVVRRFRQKGIWFVVTGLIAILYMIFVFNYPSIVQELKL
jgi:hypothetical protein